MIQEKTAKFQFTLAGLVIGIIFLGMIAASLAYFASGVEKSLGITTGSNITLSKYNRTQEITQYAQDLRNSSQISTEKGILDVIGGFFSSGWGALKTSLASIDLFDSLLNDMAQDIEYFGFFKVFIVSIVLVGVFLYVLIGALLKWQI